MGKQRPNVIRDKSFAFAIRIVGLYKYLSSEKREYVMSKQLLRSGTAIGALVREAAHAESRADFIHKMAIAQKEANETEYWLELLFQTEFLDNEQFEPISDDIKELNKILASIIVSSKERYL